MNACIDACTVERIKLMWPHERLVERSLSTDDLETFFGTIVVHCQYKPQLVALSGVLSAPYCIGGHIASVVILRLRSCACAYVQVYACCRNASVCRWDAQH